MPVRRQRMLPMAKMARMVPMKPLPPPPAEADIIAAGGSIVTTATGAKVITMPSAPAASGATPDALRESDPLAALPVRCDVYCVGGYST